MIRASEQTMEKARLLESSSDIAAGLLVAEQTIAELEAEVEEQAIAHTHYAANMREQHASYRTEVERLKADKERLDRFKGTRGTVVLSRVLDAWLVSPVGQTFRETIDIDKAREEDGEDE